MASSNNNTETATDDFLQEIMAFPSLSSSADGLPAPPSAQLLHLTTSSSASSSPHPQLASSFPLRLSLDQSNPHHLQNSFHGEPMPAPVPLAPNPPSIRPRVRARRGQATDPHSIAERLRRERIAERVRALQELVPSVNKTDRAAMVDEIVDYVKFLRLQVKVLSMSRLGAPGAVAPLVTDIPLSSIEDESGEPVWDKWSNDGTERQVAKLMEENIGAAMQFLQSKALCIMPISLASAIYHHTQSPDTSSSIVKPESNP